VALVTGYEQSLQLNPTLLEDPETVAGRKFDLQFNRRFGNFREVKAGYGYSWDWVKYRGRIGDSNIHYNILVNHA